MVVRMLWLSSTTSRVACFMMLLFACKVTDKIPMVLCVGAYYDGLAKELSSRLVSVNRSCRLVSRLPLGAKPVSHFLEHLFGMLFWPSAPLVSKHFVNFASANVVCICFIPIILL